MGSSSLKVKVLVTPLCPTLCDPMDCSPPGSSDHGIPQARTLEWVAISSSRGSSQPRDWMLTTELLVLSTTNPLFPGLQGGNTV